MKFDEATPRSGRDRVDLENLVDMMRFPDNSWLSVRILPTDIFPVVRHWINIIGGKSGKEVKIPKFCVAHDTTSDSKKEGVNCPYCEINDGESFYLVNAIIREVQENEPAKAKKPSKSEKESGFKKQGSDAWTPVRVLRIPASLMAKIQGLKDLNKVKDKKTKSVKKMSVVHPKYGCDINIKYNSKASGTDKYQVQLGDRTPLEEHELEYLQFELVDSLLDKAGRENEKTAKKEMSRMELAGSEDTDDNDEDDDDEDSVSVGGKKKKGKDDKKSKSKKSKSRDEDDEDDEDEDDDDEKPSKKSKSKKSKARDEDDEDEDDEDEDDEDERPSKKSKSKPSKKSRDEDEDDDEDDEDEDDEDEDDDEDDEDEDDEDERPSKKSKSKKSSKSVKKSKSRDEDDEDEDEDDEDEDDEDEDEKPSKKSKSKKSKSDKKSKGKSAKKSKSKSRDEDDEDDDEDEDDDDIPF